MAGSIRKSEFSNFILRAGDFKLLDLLKSRLIPALNMKLEKKGGETYLYQFLNIELKEVDGEPVLVGRLLQRMNLKARQKFGKRGLKPSRAQLGSDPSSIFIITLKDHKLLVIPEQPRSPKTSTFRYVLQRIFDRQWKEQFQREIGKYKNKLKKQRLTPEERETFVSSFLKKYPPAVLSINPISALEDAAKVVDEFDEINKLRITYFKTNNEDYELEEELVTLFGKSVESLKSDKAVQEYQSKSYELDREAVGNMIEASSKTGGNSTFTVSGRADGVSKTRTDEYTQVKPEIAILPQQSIADVVSSALNSIKRLIQNKVIQLAVPTEGTDLATARAVVKRENTNE